MLLVWGKQLFCARLEYLFNFDKKTVENVALHSGYGEEPTSHEAMSPRDDSGKEKDISLYLPLGYDTSSANSEC